MLIPNRAFVVTGDFAGSLSAEAVAAAIGRGLQAGGLPAPDLCPLPRAEQANEVIKALLVSLHFDARMSSARAVILANEHLEESTLAGSVAFEMATRARQAGVPAYAVTAHNDLDAFDSRILDLQLILEAHSTRALLAAGKKLARLL